MAKGSTAKENVIKKIIQVYPNLFEYDKKYYIMENDGGEMVQIAISLTCPKNPVQVDVNVSTVSGDWDFSDTPKVNTVAAVSSAAPAEITEEEKANISELMARLGL